jgi:NAD(P)-dependent dehydrogenase (short-subunit alcohol dehydrogenase family)
VPSPEASRYLRYFDFSGKTACVTGAASGIGKATALLLADLGATVHLADCNESALEEMARTRPSSFRFTAYDQAESESIRHLAGSLGVIDILINNAGIHLYQPLLELKRTDLERIIATNLMGSIELTRLVGEGMVARGSGSVVHTGSQVVFNGAEWRAAYAASKAGISQFVKTAALEWGKHGVRVNCIAPGRTLTAMNSRLLSDPAAQAEGVKRIALGRFGEPEDIANAMAFLASDASGYVTGHTLVVDGGWILF